MENNFNIDLNNLNSRAVSGNFPTSNQYIVYWIECIQNSQNIANNTTNVTVKVWIKRTNTGYETYGSGTVYCTINGTQYSASLTSSQKITSSPLCIFNKTMDIGHNSDGTKTLSMASYISHSKVTSSSHSYSQTLTAIPRVSTFTLNTDRLVLGQTACTVTINKSSSNFTHKVYYRFGSLNHEKYNGVGNTVSFTPYIADCSQIPNSVTGTGTIVVETWNGSTKLGQNSRNITLVVPDNIKPTFDNLGAELVSNGIDISYGYIQNKSKCKLTVNGAYGQYGSNITNYSVSGGGHSSNAWQSTTNIITQSGTVTFSAYVVDSRGRKSDTKTVTINVKPYDNPRLLEFTARRCLINGQVDEDGTYAKVSTRYTFSNLGGINTLEALVGYRKTGDSEFTVDSQTPSQDGSIAIGGKFDTTFAYEIRVTLRDKFTSIGQSVTLATSFVTLDFKKGGKGIAIGKASEQDNLLDINMPTNIRGGLTVDGVPITGDKGGTEVDWGNVPSMNVNGQLNLRNKLVINNYTPPTNNAYMTIGTSIDNNGNGDGMSHLGYRDTSGNLNHYFRGKGTFIVDNHGGIKAQKVDAPQWIQTTEFWFRTGGKIMSPYNNNYVMCDHNNGNITMSACGGHLFLGYQNTNALNISKCGLISVEATSGANLNINRQWSGSSGSEVSIYNSKGKGWGFIGGNSSENAFFRIYGSGGSVSARESKYDIQKYDTEALYDYVKSLNVYGYRSISDERDDDNNVISEHKRSDMYLGCMVDELPTEAVFYDNEGGTGKAVDNYAYSTMIMGAVKHLQTKVETLEADNNAKDRVISDLEARLLKLEEMILNGTN